MPKEHHHYNVIQAFLEVATLVGQIQDVPVMPGSAEGEVPELGLTASAAELLNRMISLQGKSMRIAVVGAVSRGKSTLINALLGEERLPDDMEACTGVITEVVYGTNVDEVMLVEKDKRRMVPHTEFLNTVRLTPEEQHSLRNEKAFVMPDRLTEINYAVLEAEYPLGEKGLHIVDTLGFRAGTDAEKITKAFLTQADVLVFVTRAHPVFEEADEAFLKTQLRRNESRLEHIFFVINDFSGLDASERAEVMATARVRLKDYFLTPDDKFDEALFERRVFIVDARIALRAQLDGEKGDAPESTGLPAFARAMQQMMEDGEYLSIKLDAAIVETLIPALNEAGRNIANKRQHLTSDKRGRDTAQVTSEMSRLEAIEARLSELFDQISYEVYGRVLTEEEYQQISRKRIAEMCELGSLALANADYKQALIEFSKVLDLDPDSEEVYVGIAEAHFGLEALEDAEQAAGKALSLNPDSAATQAAMMGVKSAYFDQGIGALEKGAYKSAREAFDKVVSLNPEDAVVYEDIADAYLKLGRKLDGLENAVNAAREALRLNPDSRKAQQALAEIKSEYLLRGASRMENEDYKGAEVEFGKAYAIDSKNEKVDRLRRGIAGMRIGNYPSAITHFEKALAIDPEDAKIYAYIAMAYLKLNYFPNAAQRARVVLRLDPNSKLAKKVLNAAEASIVKQAPQEGSYLDPISKKGNLGDVKKQGVDANRMSPGVATTRVDTSKEDATVNEKTDSSEENTSVGGCLGTLLLIALGGVGAIFAISQIAGCLGG